jgi:hypothetical protein
MSHKARETPLKAEVQGIRRALDGRLELCGHPTRPLGCQDHLLDHCAGTRGTDQVQFRDRTIGGRTITSSQTSLTTLPAAWTSGTIYQNAPLSAHASQ